MASASRRSPPFAGPASEGRNQGECQPFRERRAMNERRQGLIFSTSLLSFGLFALLLAAGSVPASAKDHDHSEHAQSAAPTVKAADIDRDPSDLPPPITRREPALVRVTLTSKELIGVLDPASGTTYRYWTFNGKVPGPFIRVRQGDTVEVTLANAKDSSMVHSIVSVRPTHAVSSVDDLRPKRQGYDQRSSEGVRWQVPARCRRG